MKPEGIKKLYYSISEVSRLTGLKSHVLRYWETEFPVLAPKKNRAGNRIYTLRDIETVQRIKHLLRVQKYTIEGARQALERERSANGTEAHAGTNAGAGYADAPRAELLRLRAFLADVLQRLG